jgi:hypothetical protein
MVRLLVLLVALSAILLVPVAAMAATSECGSSAAAIGCPNVSGSTDGDSVILDGNESQPGSPSGADNGPDGATRPPFLTWVVLFESCRVGLSYEQCINAAEELPPITLRDIAAFTPTPGLQQMEPDGWTVAGLDTNFYAITEPHVVPGTLLGRPADVRFTPIAFRWAYGDGTTATLPTSGTTWAALGVTEFEPTPTSHVYEQLGDYTITLSITFAAEYRFDGGAWTPVVGQLTLPANDLYLRVGTAKTVLVDRDCRADPSGPGC